MLPAPRFRCRRPDLKRKDARPPDQSRPLKLTRSFTQNAIGSVLAESGDTRVLCTVSHQDQVPPWMAGSGNAWLTAEYAMLPGSTAPRKARERGARYDARSLEIQRLIGRTLRSVLDTKSMPEITLWVDCDVLSADGGTRTTAINGAYVALFDALLWLEERKSIRTWPLRNAVSAVSVGLVDGVPLLDLDYQEDVRADVDMNVVMTDDGRFVEVQGTAERSPFDAAQLQGMLDLARDGCAAVHALQKAALGP